jgi:hypothetical protein
MASAMPALEPLEIERTPTEGAPTEVALMETWEDTPQASSRLLKAQCQEVEVEIEHAKSILRQPELDDKESLYSEETLDRAVAFMKTHIESVWRSYGVKAPIPTIGPGPHGSVDLYWEQPSWKLLVNIPADKDAPATFYGDDYGRQKIKGSLDSKALSITIVAWLTA